MLQVNAFIDVRLFYKPLTVTTLPKTDTLQHPEAVYAPSSPGGALTTLLRDLDSGYLILLKLCSL